MYIEYKEFKQKITTDYQIRPLGLNLLDQLDTNLENFSIERLKDILSFYMNKEQKVPLDDYIIKKVSYLIDLEKNYAIRKPYHNILSVKLVLPVPCQANCQFCFHNHKDYGNKMSIEEKEKFLNNFIDSIKYTAERAHGKPMSLDITGGEPTFDIEFLSRVMEKCKQNNIKKYFKRITLTSNGYRIFEALPIIHGFVDYVNISLHNTSYEERCKLFKTNKIPDNENLGKLILEAKIKYNIKVSSVFVINDISYDDFTKMNEWCLNLGFATNRVRFDVFTDCHAKHKTEKLISKCRNHMEYSEIYTESDPEADFSVINYKNNLSCFVMDGIPETYAVTKGIEILIRTDGKVYTDYGGKTLLEDDPFLPINYTMSKIMA